MMKKRTFIKIFFILFSLTIILFYVLDLYQSRKSYKTLANWKTAKMGVSETAYYSKRIRNIITKWQQVCNSPDNIEDYYKTFLHIDLEKKAIWLEENGKVKKQNYTNLPEKYSWDLCYPGTSNQVILKKAILRTRRVYEEFTGCFTIRTRYFSCFFDAKTFHIGFNLSGMQQTNISSLIISQEQYNQYEESIIEAKSDQSDENEDSEKIALQENISRWLEAEKLFYKEIEGQIINAGYEFDSIEITAGPDYTAAHAIITAHGENVLFKLLDLGGSSKTIRAYFKIDYLEDGIWYVRTAPDPKRQLKSDRKFNLEFLVFAQEQIPLSKYRKYIKQGRGID